ncbi:MAG TPA: CinA family protein, partial [Jiangellaceae bacterium]|nr:CinA family protein [Jiangellaceae bacterium]
ATGVGGPDEQEGQPVGTVFIGVHTPHGTTCTEHRFDGDPQEILHAVTGEALQQLHRAIVELAD